MSVVFFAGEGERKRGVSKRPQFLRSNAISRERGERRSIGRKGGYEGDFFVRRARDIVGFSLTWSQIGKKYEWVLLVALVMV